MTRRHSECFAGWREETVAFSTGFEITIEEGKSLTVQQNIHYAGDAPQTGATIYAPLRVTSDSGSSNAEPGSESQVLQLTRASVYERSLGLRGSDDGRRVLRNSVLRWRGFDDAPADGPIVTTDGLVVLGRSRTKNQGGSTDVRMLIHNPDGSLDEANSRGISRNHCCLWIENDRLMLRAESELGAWCDGHKVLRGKAVELRNGSRFSPSQKNPSLCQIQARFDIEHDQVVGITFSRGS